MRYDSTRSIYKTIIQRCVCVNSMLKSPLYSIPWITWVFFSSPLTVAAIFTIYITSRAPFILSLTAFYLLCVFFFYTRFSISTNRELSRILNINCCTSNKTVQPKKKRSIRYLYSFSLRLQRMLLFFARFHFHCDVILSFSLSLCIFCVVVMWSCIYRSSLLTFSNRIYHFYLLTHWKMNTTMIRHRSLVPAFIFYFYSLYFVFPMKNLTLFLYVYTQ